MEGRVREVAFQTARRYIRHFLFRTACIAPPGRVQHSCLPYRVTRTGAGRAVSGATPQPGVIRYFPHERTPFMQWLNDLGWRPFIIGGILIIGLVGLLIFLRMKPPAE